MVTRMPRVFMGKQMGQERFLEYGAVFIVLVAISSVVDFALVGGLHPLAILATGLGGVAAVWTIRRWFRRRHRAEEDDWNHD